MFCKKSSYSEASLVRNSPPVLSLSFLTSLFCSTLTLKNSVIKNNIRKQMRNIDFIFPEIKEFEEGEGEAEGEKERRREKICKQIIVQQVNELVFSSITSSMLHFEGVRKFVFGRKNKTSGPLCGAFLSDMDKDEGMCFD